VAATAKEGLVASASASAARNFSSDKAFRQLKSGADTIQALEVCIEKGYISTRSMCLLGKICNTALNRCIFNSNLKKVRHINNIIKRISDSATSGVEGVSGSIGERGIVTLFNCVPGGVAGKSVFDLGLDLG
jgi:hypothetical protein